MNDMKNEPIQRYIFFREDGFYHVDLPEDSVMANIELNPGTVQVVTMYGVVIWRKEGWPKFKTQ